MNKNLQYVAAWFAFSVIAVAIAMLYQSAAFVDGQWIPVGNDAFYHARRIIDAAVGDRGFYQFDGMIHVPEGSWLNWPWAYDYLLAMALKLALVVRPELEPMKFLAFVPVAWLFVNAGLLTMIAREVNLDPLATALGLLVFSLLPLTLSLHGLGSIDHHFIEMTFVLAVVWLGLRFFRRPGRNQVVALGVVLGIAPAFHNGLFILQLPVLAAALALWLQDNAPPGRLLLLLGATIFVTTLVAVLPSAPFRDMQFEFWTLSWFHLYVSLSAAVVLAYVAWRPSSPLNVGLFAGLAIVLLLPLIATIATGAAFVTGELDIIRDIHEVQSPIAKLWLPGGLQFVLNLYSWLFFLAPVLAAYHVMRLIRERDAQQVFLSIAVVFGLGLMLLQYRLHPFGSWAVIVAGLLAADRVCTRLAVSKLAGTAVTLVVIAIALQPPLTEQLFKRVPPGANVDYAAARSMYPVLAAACEREAGAVLSYSDDGHPIRYHTNCGVLINNFLITPFHRRKISEAAALRQLSPEDLLDAAPQVRYVFVRMTSLFRQDASGVVPIAVEDVQRRNDRLFVALTFSADLPPEYRLLGELRLDDGRDFAFVRVFEIDRELHHRD